MNLPATPEGRPDLYLVDAADTIAWLNRRAAGQNHIGDGEIEWHCMIPAGPILTGADWSHRSVVEILAKPGIRLAINLDRGSCMLHQLAAADDADERLYVFDVGEVTLSDLELT